MSLICVFVGEVVDAQRDGIAGRATLNAVSNPRALTRATF
jgi:hypothetical protein